MNDNTSNRNLIITIVLSAAILFGWQYFVAGPAMKADAKPKTPPRSIKPSAALALGR